MNSTIAKEIAATIASQIGKRAFFMLGAKDLVSGTMTHGGYERAFLGFKIRGSRSVNYIRVILDEGADTYVLQFVKYNSSEIKIIKEIDGVYCDQLHELIEENTGLYTSL